MRFITFLARNLVRRRTRSALTVLGIALAVGAMVALLSLSRRFSEAMAESFRQRGVDLVIMARGVIDQLHSDIDEQVVDQIRKIPGVRSVAPGLVEYTEIQRGNESIPILVQGWPSENFAHNDVKIIAGRGLDYSERGKLLLGSVAAENLGKRPGDTVLVVDKPFEVVGVYDSFVVYEKGGMVMPLRELQELMGRTGNVTGISVVCEDAPDKEALVQQVKERIEALPALGRGRKGLSAMSVRDYLKNAIHLRITQGMAWLVSAIAVVIGTIGMVNTMVMSVLERVHEIGILRAVGWPRSRVVRMVLGETLLLVLCGAVVGVVGAILLVQLLTQVPAVNGFIDGKMSPEAILEGLGIAMLMALVGGLYPAYRAARLDPTEALRYE
jgi:putative ABC transport system permease protein